MRRVSRGRSRAFLSLSLAVAAALAGASSAAAAPTASAPSAASSGPAFSGLTAVGLRPAAVAPLGRSGSVPFAATVRAEPPEVDEMAVGYVVDECKVSRKQARLILRVQDRSDAVIKRTKAHRGVVTFYLRECRPGLVVQILRGTRRAPLRKIARRYRMARWTSFVTVEHTLKEIHRAQRAIGRKLDDLFTRCLLTTAEDTVGNGVSIELSTDATADDLARVRRAIAESPVPVELERRPGSLCGELN